MERQGESADGRTHNVRVIDTPDPRVFGVECTCGYRAIAFFGMVNVEVIIGRHYRDHGIRTVVGVL